VTRVLLAGSGTVVEDPGEHGVVLTRRRGEQPRLGIASVLVLMRITKTWQSQGQGLAALIEAMTPEQRDLPTPAAVLQARRNAEARNALLAEFGALRSSEIAELAGSRAANRAALANRWRAAPGPS
jgi:hypothetical protein